MKLTMRRHHGLGPLEIDVNECAYLDYVDDCGHALRVVFVSDGIHVAAMEHRIAVNPIASNRVLVKEDA